MFTATDQRARFAAKAHDYPEPRPEQAFNEIATPNLVTHIAGLRVWFLTNGLEANFYGVMQGIFEEIGEHPLPEPTNWMTVEHAALSRLYRSARAAWETKRVDAA